MYILKTPNIDMLVGLSATGTRRLICHQIKESIYICICEITHED